MSRFYDLLKQASRSLHDPESETGMKDSAAVPTDVAELLGTVGAPDAGPADLPVTTLATSLAGGHGDLDRAMEGESRADVAANAGVGSRNGSFGIITDTQLDHSSRLLLHTADTMITEHYRLLRTQLLRRQAARMFRSLLIASAGPGEGKTVTLLNLGLAFAMLPSFRVLVVDGDLRRGTIGNWLGTKQDQAGFSDLLEGSVQLEQVVLKSEAIPISFTVRGTSAIPPPELLHSPRLKSSFQEMAERFDLVLVDSPPANLLTDAQLLAGMCDAVLLVARAFTTTQGALEEAASKLRAFHLVGTVLNGAASIGSPSGYRSYY